VPALFSTLGYVASWHHCSWYITVAVAVPV
jgi:hypothetical protein